MQAISNSFRPVRFSGRSLLIILALDLLFACGKREKPYSTWEVYGGSKENIHYSVLDQIDTANVNKLTVAWIYHTGDADTVNHSQIQCNPIIIGDRLYGVSPKLQVFALDAATGKNIWAFNPFDSSLVGDRSFFVLNNCRGITYRAEGDEARIYFTAGSYLFCVDAHTGKAVTGFGNGGKVDLHQGLGRDVHDLFVTATAPGVIYKDLLILGSRVSEGSDAAPGHIRAFDVHTGKQRWIFHTIPDPGEFGYETWEDSLAYQHIGGANSWSGLSLDEARGIVFAPVGSASFDFYGGLRKGKGLFADCLVALDAATGKRIWHFQDIHHDVWDRDLPAPPALVTVMHNGKKTDAVAQTTKTGFVFLLDRETGQPLFPVEERPVPDSSGLAGEKLWPTQPIPALPRPFARQVLNESDLNDLGPDSSYQDIKKRLQTYHTGRMFNPPSKAGTIVLPGFDGGAEWGGPAFDPTTGWLYVNANEMPWVLTMVDVKQQKPQRETNLAAGMRLYQHLCISCHGPDRKGSGNYPSLLEVNKKYDLPQFAALISSGRRMMPAFNQLSEEEKTALGSFILSIKSSQSKAFTQAPKPTDPYRDLPYTNTGYNKFLTKEGYPAIRPPWGTLTAINLNTGEQGWQITLGEYPEFKARGIATGTENYGGPLVTANGLLFIAATRDGKIRAFHKASGRLLWEYTLPAAGFATPALYSVNGREFLVIACGGGKLNTRSGDSYIAFALP